jgi:hypothetical protein
VAQLPSAVPPSISASPSPTHGARDMFDEDGIPHVAMRLDLGRADPQRPEAR